MLNDRLDWTDINRALPDWTPSACIDFLMKYQTDLDRRVYEGIKSSIRQFAADEGEIRRLEDE
jgi:hypothetical protein